MKIDALGLRAMGTDPTERGQIASVIAFGLFFFLR